MIPEETSRYFGLYHLENGEPHNIAMPLWHWGKFYEQLIRTIMDGTWKYDDNYETKAINYWWGLSAGVVDVIHSQNLPIGTSPGENSIRSREFCTLRMEWYSQIRTRLFLRKRSSPWTGWQKTLSVRFRHEKN